MGPTILKSLFKADFLWLQNFQSKKNRDEVLLVPSESFFLFVCFLNQIYTYNYINKILDKGVYVSVLLCHFSIKVRLQDANTLHKCNPLKAL